MKVINKKSDTFECNLEISDLENHQEINDASKDGRPVIEKTTLSYSKRDDNFYISNYYASPGDSYGGNWEISDSGCFSYTDQELKELINQLNFLREFRSKLKGDQS